MKTIVERFWSRVKKTERCWLWTGVQNGHGYGRLNAGGRPKKAHRVSWELANGPIPEGLCVLHKCDVRACVNPAHLFLGTPADNAADMRMKGRNARVGAPGETHGRARLTAVQVLAIRGRVGHTQQDLAEEFGVTQAHISRILLGKLWSHI